MTETALPLFPEAPPVGRPDPAGVAVRCRGGVGYFELPAREILNRNRNSRMPFQWTINPYRGCEFACAYCYARYTHGYLGFDHWRDFENRIFVKRGARRALERRLKRASLVGEAITIGTVTDPYQPAEAQHGVTRSILEAFLAVHGLQLSIATKSPLILRDLDLLAKLDRRHAVTVSVSLTTADPALARRLEPQAPGPRARLRTVAGLANEGIATSVLCMPILPKLTDGAAVLTPLLREVRAAGAFNVVGAPLSLRPAARARFWPWLRQEFPDLVPIYRRLYARRSYLRDRQREEVMAEFRRLRLRYGFPTDRPGRG